MASRNTDINRVNLAARHQLRFLHSALDGIDRGFNIDHDTLFHASRRVRPNTDNLNTSVGVNLADHGNNLGGPNIETDNHLFTLGVGHQPSPPTLVSCMDWRTSPKVTAAPCSYRRSTFCTACTVSS